MKCLCSSFGKKGIVLHAMVQVRAKALAHGKTWVLQKLKNNIRAKLCCKGILQDLDIQTLSKRVLYK